MTERRPMSLWCRLFHRRGHVPLLDGAANWRVSAIIGRLCLWCGNIEKKKDQRR